MTATLSPPPAPAPPELAAPSIRQRLLSGSTLGPLAALIIACAFFSIRSDRFLTGGNFSLIIQQVMVVGTLAIGQTLIILTAGIDLSNGAIIAFALTHIYSQEQTVTGLPGTLTALGQTFTVGGTEVTYGSIITILVFLL